MGEHAGPRQVRAVYNFTGSNNDELNFQKGDCITITQIIEGGWWEGTLNGKTGWFPSNYVKEIKAGGDAASGADARSPTPGGNTGDEPVRTKRESMFYHKQVLQSILETERKLVNDLHTLLHTFLRPLKSANVVTAEEYSDLCGNLEAIAALHENILASVTECDKQPVVQQRIGGMFLRQAATLQTLYEEYCQNHPKAVEVLQRKRSELSAFMEQQGAKPPGVMKLTTSLSVPFTRLDKYSSLLKELERHTDESHVDRGDTQRAISVYRQISLSCTEIRRQKELEREILSATVHNWEGEPLSQLGEVLQMSHLRVESGGEAGSGEKHERLFLLFPGVIVMMSVAPATAGVSASYVYEGKIATSGLQVATEAAVAGPADDDDDDLEHAFTIAGGSGSVELRVLCSTEREQQTWVDRLREQARHGPVYITTPQSIQVSTSQPAISQLSQAKNAQVLPKSPYQPWSGSCLRPCPPLRPCLLGAGGGADPPGAPPRSPRSGRRRVPPPPAPTAGYASLTRNRKTGGESVLLEDASLVLKVIEAYCTSAKTRHTVNSSILESPHMLIAEDEKIIVEEVEGDQTVVEEKSLVDTVYLLRDTVNELKQEQAVLASSLAEERRCRQKLEMLVRGIIAGAGAGVGTGGCGAGSTDILSAGAKHSTATAENGADNNGAP